MPINNRLILFIFLLFAYNTAIFAFIETFLENRRIRKSMMYIVYAFNTLLFTYVVISDSRNITMQYIFIILCLLAELILLYKEPVLRLIFVALAVTTHIMIIRAIMMSVYALIYKYSLYEINQSIFALDSLNISMAILICISVLVKIVIPAKAIKIINQNKEQLLFMTLWLIFSNGYFIFNSLIFLKEDTSLFVKYNVIAVSITMFFALYTVLLFTIKTGQLLNYKEKSDILSNIVEDEKQFKNSVIDQAIVGLEVNISENRIISGFGKSYEKIENKNDCYSEIISNSLPFRIYKEDLESVLEFMSEKHLSNCYEHGEVDLTIEFRAMLFGSTEYIWLKTFITLYKASVTNCIMAFIYSKDINVEKKLELEIKKRSERDTLTGLYNHGMTKQLVNEFINSQTNPPYKGALLIIDLDNFKLINDNFGHVFGDDLLHEISRKLTSIFRCDNNINSLRKEDDIVGRIGGDEFMVFVKTSEIEGLKIRLQNICDLIKTVYTTSDGKTITISASIGIALVTDKTDNFKTLYAKADTALYLSKRKGKDGFSFYNGEKFQGYEGEK
ncbi:MAG: GGDEF domain-containing protein [Lachnospiraceae bacterium]